MRSPILTTVVLYILLETLCLVTCRQSERQTHNHSHHKHHRSNDARSSKRSEDEDSSSSGGAPHSNHIRRSSNHRPPAHSRRGHWSSEEESEEGEHGRHAYVMSTDHLTTTPSPAAAAQEEDRTLQDAFQKHMNPSPGFKAPHDIYAYKLPSELWFIVSYKKGPEGKTEKYMNVVSSFTNYLDKLDTSTKSVSVNVKGVETVFRLTSKS